MPPDLARPRKNTPVTPIFSSTPHFVRRITLYCRRRRAKGGPMMQRGWKLALAGAICLAGGVLAQPTAHADEPRVHVVYKGQRLGSIAQRYNVSIDALRCERDHAKEHDTT